MSFPPAGVNSDLVEANAASLKSGLKLAFIFKCSVLDSCSRTKQESVTWMYWRDSGFKQKYLKIKSDSCKEGQDLSLDCSLLKLNPIRLSSLYTWFKIRTFPIFCSHHYGLFVFIQVLYDFSLFCWHFGRRIEQERVWPHTYLCTFTSTCTQRLSEHMQPPGLSPSWRHILSALELLIQPIVIDHDGSCPIDTGHLGSESLWASHSKSVNHWSVCCVPYNAWFTEGKGPFGCSARSSFFCSSCKDSINVPDLVFN